MDIWIINGIEVVLKHILLNVCGCHFRQERRRHLEALNIGPDLAIEHGRCEFMMMAETANDLAHNSHDALVAPRIDHMPLALRRLNGH